MIINNPSLISPCRVIPGVSDHDAVLTEINLMPLRNKQTPRKNPLYKMVDWIGQEKHISEFGTFRYIKVSNEAKIRNQYNQVPHPTKDTTWESDKTKRNTTDKRGKRLSRKLSIGYSMFCVGYGIHTRERSSRVYIS